MGARKREDRKTQEGHVREMLRAFYFSNASGRRLAETSKASELDYLEHLLKDELAYREQTKKVRMLSKAGFPLIKTFEGYSFENMVLPSSLGKDSLMALDFIRDKKDIIFFGGCGTGKTHATTALGVLACNAGYKVKFTTVTSLVLRLSEAFKAGNAERIFKDYQSADLICLDEWGYVPVDRNGSQLLYRIISDSYEHRSLIITTNLPFQNWGTLFTDEQLAAAMIDRLVHHGYLIGTGDKSWRMTHALMREGER
ncbi:IS21-like element helper ATPase IstB [uncultured Sphaerochaeta sp.]|uniref:IS21-like element helper ATPase IstB n=1 Tax=uncultured Sphaerochaeta sp. TaxID=886478 RepID=UPI002A0A32D6|nr:IS21-like element helper ATPase IstB [uncultured Sphaerochaeta sp.]